MEGWKTAIRKNRPFLVKNIDIVDSGLWDFIGAADVATDMQIQNMQSKDAANNKQVGYLLDHMMRRPEKDFLAFKECLRESGNVDAAALLDAAYQVTASSGIVRPAVVQQTFAMPGNVHVKNLSGVTTGSSDAIGVGLNEAATNLKMLNLSKDSPAHPEKILDVQHQLKEVKAEVNPHLDKMHDIYIHKKKNKDCYPMESRTRGLAIIITMTGNRQGWDSDVLALEKMFLYLKVQTEYHFDLSAKDVKDKLKTFASDPKVSAVDALFVVLMGHGGKWNEKEFLKAADGVFYIMDEFKEIFDNTKNPRLIDKPKVFIVQMCRGDQLNDVIDAASKSKTQTDAVAPRAVGNFTDYLYGFATQSGIKSYRDCMEGSWYIQLVTDLFVTRGHELHAEEILAKVNHQLEIKAGSMDKQAAQVGERHSTLKHALYLFPGMMPCKQDK